MIANAPPRARMAGDLASLAILAVITLGFFWPALATPGALIWPHSGLGSDISYRHWPDLTGYAADWRAGRLPLWDSSAVLIGVLAVAGVIRFGRLNVAYVRSQALLAGPGFQLVLDGEPAVHENLRWTCRGSSRAALIGLSS